MYSILLIGIISCTPISKYIDFNQYKFNSFYRADMNDSNSDDSIVFLETEPVRVIEKGTFLEIFLWFCQSMFMSVC